VVVVNDAGHEIERSRKREDEGKGLTKKGKVRSHGWTPTGTMVHQSPCIRIYLE